MALGSVNVPGKLTAKDVGAAPVWYNYLGFEKAADMLGVDLNEPKHLSNKTQYFDGVRSEYSNVPSGLGMSDDDWISGIREVHFMAPRRLLVKITEFHPNPGRCYYNHFNQGDWAGWYNPDNTAGLVPDSRTISGKPLTEDISLSIADVGGSNPNLLDNWYFNGPVNQRMQDEYCGAGYAIDRWMISEPTSKLSVNDGFVTLGGPTTQILYQILELTPIAGKTLTMSVLTKDGVFATVTGTMSGNGNVSHEAEIPNSNWRIDIWEVDGQLRPRIYKTAEADESIRLAAVKLELGDQQTLARQDAHGNWILSDPPPDKALELTKCQRYYQRVSGVLFTGTITNGSSDSDKKIAYCPFRYAKMRTIPAIHMTGTAWVRSGNTAFSSEEIANIDGATDESVMLWFEVGDDAVIGASGSVYLAPDAHIDFIAEI